MSKHRCKYGTQHFSRQSGQEFDSRLFVWLLPMNTLDYQMMGIIVKEMLINIGLTLLAIFAISWLMTVRLTTTILLLLTLFFK